MMAAWRSARRKGADSGVALSSMAAYYATPGEVVKCVARFLELPLRVADPRVVQRIVEDISSDLERKASQNSSHVTGVRNDVDAQRALLETDPTAAPVLARLRTEIAAAFSAGPVCGDRF
mmetsp:Transcript_20047/g.60595  ORF Transcript_20047/g.60595 Transcript_20047/m.60595 type:complete len:120 (+) Transcript_20047:727-1086(+)